MREIDSAPVVVMNFSGAYQMECFAQNPDFVHIDCTDIRATECMLGREANREISRRIEGFGARGIHFIDSGDYHYMTKLWTDKIDRPFTLVLVDHHTDMQPAQVPGVLTCGDWVNSVIDQNPFLRKVVILGMPAKSLEQIPDRYRDRVEYLSRQQFHDILDGRQALPNDGDIYLSIDKDVLDEHSAVTNWDQGEVTLAELRRFVALLLTNENLIGIDVCGEFPAMKSLFEEEQAATIDSQANEAILDTVACYVERQKASRPERKRCAASVVGSQA
jgi:arginase family enzyme